MRRRSLKIIGVTLLSVVLVFFISGRISAPESTDSSPSYSDGQQVSVRGEMTCLPHKDTSGPQTMECAFGLKVSEEEYYSLQDTTSDYTLLGNTPFNTPVLVTGQIEMKEDPIYKSSGVIKVSKIEIQD